MSPRTLRSCHFSRTFAIPTLATLRIIIVIIIIIGCIRESVYDAVVIATVHSVHSLNGEQSQVTVDSQTKSTDLGCETACRLQSSIFIPTVAGATVKVNGKPNSTLPATRKPLNRFRQNNQNRLLHWPRDPLCQIFFFAHLAGMSPYR